MPRRLSGMSLTADWETVFGKKKSAQSKPPGYTQEEKPPITFCTESVYSGFWNKVGMAGFGTYTFPHKVEYEGTLADGQFHGEGILQYPMGQKIEGQWENGELKIWKYRFTDGLEYEIPWNYCAFPDRQFNLSIREGLRPACKELRTRDYVPRDIPPGCYDTGDGFYNPKTKCVMSAFNRKMVLRIPTAAEETWIMENCRRAWDEPVGYKPDLYKYWTTGRRAEQYDEECETESCDTAKATLVSPPSPQGSAYSQSMWMYEMI